MSSSEADSILSSYCKRRGISKKFKKDIFCSSSNINNSSDFSFLLSSSAVINELKNYIYFLKTLSGQNYRKLSSINLKILNEIRILKFIFVAEQRLIFDEFLNMIPVDNVQTSDFVLDDYLFDALRAFVKNENAYFLNSIFQKFLYVEISDKNDRVANIVEKEEDNATSDNFKSGKNIILGDQPSLVLNRIDGSKLNTLCEFVKNSSGDNDYANDILFCYSLSFKNDISSVDLSRDRSRMLVGLNTGRIIGYNLLTNLSRTPRNYFGYSAVNAVKYIVSNENENIFLSGFRDGSVKLWKDKLVSNGDPLFYDYLTNDYPVMDLDSDENNVYFLASSYNRCVYLFAYENVNPLRILAGHSDSVQSASFLPGLIHNGRDLIGSISMDKSIIIWSAEHALPVKIFYPPNACYPTIIKSVPFLDHSFLCGTTDRKLFLYDYRFGEKPSQILDLQDFVPYHVDFRLNDRSLYVAGSNGFVKRFDWDEKRESFEDTPRDVFCINNGVSDCVISKIKAPSADYSYLTCVATDCS